MYIFGKDISEPVYFGVHYLEMYILGNEKLLDVYFRDKPSFYEKGLYSQFELKCAVGSWS